MKQLLFLFIFFLTVFTTTAQEHFKIADHSLIWQKVYEVPADASTFQDQLLKNAEVTDIYGTDGGLIVTVQNLAMDYKSLGKTEMGTSIYLGRGTFNLLAVIDFKEGKYRVTVKDIVNVMGHTGGALEQGERMPLEDVALRKGNTEFSKHFLKADAEIFDHTFNKLFTFNTTTDRDW